MPGSWWNLPGPGEFVRRVVYDLRSGRNVVILVPEWAPAGLREAIAGQFPRDGGWFWEELRPSEWDDPCPLAYLSARFVGSSFSSRRAGLQALTACERFRGYVFWVEDQVADTWHAWRQFLVEYEPHCRGCALDERSLFCVLVRGRPALDPPPAEVCLSVRTWQGQMDPLDMLLYCWSLFRYRGWSLIQRHLAAAICASLACWDPATAEELAQKDLPELLAPQSTLAAIAESRGWNCAPLKPWPELWAEGKADLYGGTWRLHSALLACQPSDAELRSRLWQGQISVLLPFLEEKRRELLRKYGSLLRLPFVTTDGRKLSTLEELELSHIAYQLAEQRALSDRERSRVRRLARLRNRLAHLELLAADDLAVLDDMS